MAQGDGTYQSCQGTVSEQIETILFAPQKLCLNGFCISASIVHPGTTKDIDFYFTAAHDTTSSFPPETEWSTIPQRGIDPPPRVLPRNSMMHQQQPDDQSSDYI